MSKTNRTSGHSFERKMANEFIPIGWPKAKRHLEYQVAEATGIDLDHTDPFDVQRKNMKDYYLAGIEELPSRVKRYKLLITNRKGRYPVLGVMYTTQFNKLIDLALKKFDVPPLINTIDVNKLNTNRWRKYVNQYDCIVYKNLSIFHWENFKMIIYLLKQENLI